MSGHWRRRPDLAAPPGYRWTDDDVRYEKRDSYLTGCMHGMWLGIGLMLLAAAFLLEVAS